MCLYGFIKCSKLCNIPILGKHFLWQMTAFFVNLSISKWKLACLKICRTLFPTFQSEKILGSIADTFSFQHKYVIKECQPENLVNHNGLKTTLF